MPSTPQSAPYRDGPTPRQVLADAITADGRGAKLATASVGFTGHQVAEALVPVVIGAVIDRAIATSDAAALGKWILVLGILFTGLLLSWRFAARIADSVSEYGAHRLRMDIARRGLDPHGMTPRRIPGEVYAIATSDAGAVADFTHTLSTKLAAACGVLTAAVSLLVISVPLGLLVILGTPPVLILMQMVSRPLERRAETDQQQGARAGALAADLLAGLRILSGIGAGDNAARRYRTASRTSLGATLRAQRYQAMYSAANVAIAGAFLAVIAYVGGRMTAQGSISIGEFVAVVGLAQFLRGPLIDVGYFGAGLARARASANRVSALLTTERSVTAPDTPLAVCGADSLTLRQVVIAGSDPFDLDVRPGETVGLVTENSALADGLVDLLARRIEPTSGTMHLGEHRIDRLEIGDLRKHLLAAPHEAALFIGTVRDNIAALTAPGTSVDAAITASATDQVIDSLPRGLETTVTEQGNSLSGGQRQRIALARALAGQPPVLVLHNPTTAVDSVTEARIAAGIAEIRREHATLILTGSPALLAICDRVIEL
ncbi:putative ABC transport system ATP-binding protein [Rhodococcus sp. 27YEA15]|uniref:ABC transporter ATP-binding protein n=1 Tax=Rhodococcus sp. 27YEA15 TaxID=3156259 RepID=UPI003C7E4CCD